MPTGYIEVRDPRDEDDTPSSWVPACHNCGAPVEVIEVELTSEVRKWRFAPDKNYYGDRYAPPSEPSSSDLDPTWGRDVSHSHIKLRMVCTASEHCNTGWEPDMSMGERFLVKKKGKGN